MAMAKGASGAATKTRSKFDLFMDCLYEFYFENRTGPYISYGLAFVSAMVYSGIGHFAFGRSEQGVVFESVAIAVALTIVMPIAYSVGKTSAQRKRSPAAEQTTSQSNRSLDPQGIIQ
ncbi:MAG: hypothetical protein MOB07_07645 [Acidobacteria bacterium]|nr:hypothetical protein [Acidobacteriota bacterium]